MKKLKITLIALLALAMLCPAIFADDTQPKTLKFQQLPLDGRPIDGIDFPYFGHDQLSTAYSWYVGDAGTPPQFIGYRGCYMADDFGDNHETPVVCLRWWGSYLDNKRYQPVKKFMIVFESDIPAIGEPGSDDYVPSHPGVVLSTEVVTLNSNDTSLPLAAGQYTEALVSHGGVPCYEHLYEYNSVLKKPFPQKPGTVYWLKIVALVDLDPDYAMAFDQCLTNADGTQISLCDYLNNDPFEIGSCPEVTRWGWHNRDYRVKNPEAAHNVSPGEQNQQFLYDPDGFATEVWHFQDDCVSGPVMIRQTGDPTNPDVPPSFDVKQLSYIAEDYVYNSKCFDPLVGNIGVDGPIGIQRFSKDLAFELYTDPDPGPGTDCNGNGIEDSVDIANGTSKDCNNNGIPDECEGDCNGNGIPDDCDIANGTSKDCNNNGIPDECERDCNNNGIPDDCDIAAGTSLDTNNNGIPDECELPCKNPRIWTCKGGIADNFVTTGGPENTSPSPYLISNPGYCYNGGLTQYDVLPTNTCFIETLGNGCWPASRKVVAATLEIRLKAGPYIPQTDSIILKQNATVLWSLSLNNLISWKTSGADTLWNSGGAAETFNLDLSALPTTSGPPTDILSDLTAGFIDVVVADDTGVDYMVLKVTTCPCKYIGDVEYIAGIDDDFAFPTETLSQGPELTLYGGPSKNFDAPQADRPVKHTFANLPNNIQSGTLEIHLKPAKNSLACNDTLGLQVKNSGPAGLLWGRRIGTNPTGSWCAGPAGLLNIPWVAGGTGTDATIILNLAALPNTSGPATNLMAQINSDKRLDVYIQDDTVVDYMKLKLNICCRKKKVILIGDLDFDDHVNFKDLAIIARQWLRHARPAQEINRKDPPCPSCP